MEVIVRNLPDQITEKQINNFFRDILVKLDIKTYSCQKLGSRGCATITIHDVFKAQQFLNTHGQTIPGLHGFKSVQRKLYHKGRQILCSKSKKDPDEFLLQSLRKEESDRYLASQLKKPRIVPAKIQESGGPSSSQRAWDTNDFKCGQWTYAGADLAFAPFFQQRGKGRVIFGQRSVRINLWLHPKNSSSHQVDIPYNSIDSFTIGPKTAPCITLSLTEAPKSYERIYHQGADINAGELQNLLQSMAINPPVQRFTRKRISAVNATHESVVASCLCYRILLAKATDIAGVQALKRFPMIPESISWNTSIISRVPFVSQMDSLKSAWTGKRYGKWPFELKFQLQKLAQNGYLSPSRVEELLSVVSRHLEKTGTTAVVQSVRNLFGQLPFPGPETESSEFTLETLTDFLVQSQASVVRGESYSSGLADRYDHYTSIHKAMVTPAGIYLYGPEPEIKNRVLRKYSAFATHFLSVSFLDENGEPLRLDRQTSGEYVYHVRYMKVLEMGINIAGRQYEFLGFSHSSLRSQTCWFMAPFVLDGSLIFAQSVIQALGDFRLIRSPAKCAARIGQTFSQTLSSVSIAPEAFKSIPDIERNGRTFSDGVGTCSFEVLREIWKKFTQARGLKPTILQIRFQGAKGVVSLDNRLEGAALCLRPSMIKFGGTNAADIEICGAALKPLPMYLNRQLIKILEDLHVPPKAFLDLQADAVEKLRMTTLSAINASSFFERNFIAKAARLPWLVRKLWAIGFSFTSDDFLRDTLELAVLIELREIKHRSRIRIEKGVTLYGIMDETGFLQENQIYCSVQTEKRGHIITGNVVITRSPALHPGDVQCVSAVDVPPESPLRALHNMVVFSSHGQRDLPSQLSGGDLDGDLYNVIYDEALYPKRLAQAADYPTPTPIDIGRPVERSDMTDFFVRFMENDNLGLIATLHQIMADRSNAGTFDPVCVALAELHSTAVDFSKTGIPVEFKSLPKFPKTRPDFQAPGPRVLIEKTINFEEEDLETSPNEENDELDEVESYEPARMRYYESPKVLGRLYREIDEQKFFEQMQARSSLPAPNTGMTHSLVDTVWNYIRDKTLIIQWRHYLEFAKDVKESYEENLIDTMLQYSSHPPHFVSEIEVFSGNILGKNGAQSKRQRETSKTMKEKHERDVEYTNHSITRGEDGKSSAEALERSIACLYVACNTVRVRKRVGTLVSFVWIAAAVCLKEVEKLPGADVLL